METFEDKILDPGVVLKIRTSWLYALTAAINFISLYLEAGRSSCVLTGPTLFMEDVGRHNAVDREYMYLNDIPVAGKMFYTTGRLTNEMVIKSVQMQITILISSRIYGLGSGCASGLLIGRARGKRFVALSGEAYRL